MSQNKWADYGITHVRFNEKHTHIDRVRIRKDNGDTFGAPEEYTRANIVDAIVNKRITFVTILEESSGKWNKGQKVFPIVINNVTYIKTVSNDKASDNLDDLPEF